MTPADLLMFIFICVCVSWYIHRFSAFQILSTLQDDVKSFGDLRWWCQDHIFLPQAGQVYTELLTRLQKVRMLVFSQIQGPKVPGLGDLKTKKQKNPTRIWEVQSFWVRKNLRGDPIQSFHESNTTPPPTPDPAPDRRQSLSAQPRLTDTHYSPNHCGLRSQT